MVKFSTDTEYEAIDCIPTFTGLSVDPLNLRLEDINIIDIAHHLSHQCRYAGATSIMYPTSQHCCILADYAHDVLKATPVESLQILMHDAPETYLPDMPRPIKKRMPQYREWDYNATVKIREWLGVTNLPIPAFQDEIDSRIIRDERAQLLNEQWQDWGRIGRLQPLGVIIEPWHPRYAEQQFLSRYAVLSQRVNNGAIQYLRAGWGIPTHSTFTPFRTAGSDMSANGEVDPHVITDLIEVDIRGGVGRVVLRSPDGMLVRDTSAGKFPRPAWEFIHGKFDLTLQGADHGLG